MLKSVNLKSVVVFSLAATLLLNAVSPVFAASDKKLTVVKTFSRKDCSLAPWLIAQKKGFLEKEGIKLEFTGELARTQQIPSLLSGDNDVSAALPNTIAVARAGGAKIKGVVLQETEPPLTANPYLRHMFWYVNKNSAIKNFGDIKKLDRKVKISIIAKNTCADFLTDRLLEKYGIPKNKVEYVVLPDIQAIQALKEGLIDIAGVHPPFYKANDKNGNRRIATSADIDKKYTATSYYIFSDAYIKKNPDVVKRFVTGMKNTERWINLHRAETNQIVQKEIGIPINANHYFSNVGTIPDKNVQAYIDGIVKAGAIKPGKIKVSDIITHQFDKYGNPPAKK